MFTYNYLDWLTSGRRNSLLRKYHFNTRGCWTGWTVISYTTFISFEDSIWRNLSRCCHYPMYVNHLSTGSNTQCM